MLGLLATLFGAASVTKAALSDVFGRDFSYHVYDQTMVAPAVLEDGAKPTDPDIEARKRASQQQMVEQEKQRVESAYKNDLFVGISALLVGLLFWVVHTFGWMKLEPTAERKQSVLFRGYVLLQLVMYSLVTLIVLPIAISQWLRHALSVDSEGIQAVPGEPVSIALWTLPVWLFFVWLTLRHVRGSSAPKRFVTNENVAPAA
jgi:hypothetical protein